MQLSVKTGSALTAKTDLLVLLHVCGEMPPIPPAFDEAYAAAKKAGDLPKKFKESLLLYPSEAGPQKRLLLLAGCPRKETCEECMRKLGAVVVQKAKQLEAKDFVVGIAGELLEVYAPERLGLLFGEGSVLGGYEFDAPSKEKKTPSKTKRGAVMAVEGALPKTVGSSLKIGALRGSAVCFTRDLGNAPGNSMTPTLLAKAAKTLHGPKVKVSVFDEARMKKEKMAALLGVSRGSSEPAKLIFFDYNPFAGKKKKGKTLCVVGKGLTFDAGGISLKPGAAMDQMRYDMCGGAAVVGLFHALANGALSPKVRVVGAVPASENLPDGNAQKPGDVVRACDGTTIEILNTDAEGRLILADALAFVKKTYKPSKIVDLATLTGAVIVALGHEMSAAIGNDQDLVDELLEAGKQSGDKLWQLPLWKVHKEAMESKFADLRNINSGMSDGAGSTSGAAFLSSFVGDTPWVHLDIAGSAWGAKEKDYYKHGATGAGVRVLLDWLAAQ